MKIDFTLPITSLSGEPIVESETRDGMPVPGTERVLTLAVASQNALLGTLVSPTGQPEQLDGTTKVRHASLAQSIFTTPGCLDLTAEDVVLLKDRIGRAYGPLTVMRAWEMLEAGKPDAPKRRG